MSAVSRRLDRSVEAAGTSACATLAGGNLRLCRFAAWTKADLSEVNIESGAEAILVATGAAESQPRYSLDGRFIAFVQTPERAHWAGDARVAVYSRKDGTVRRLSASPDERPSLLGWTLPPPSSTSPR